MKGIMFKPEMQKAVVEGRKTQTRRLGGLNIINTAPDEAIFKGLRLKKGKRNRLYAHFTFPVEFLDEFAYPRYEPGEVVYLKETFKAWEGEMGTAIFFPDESHSGMENWQNKMFMPARYARHFIEIIYARPERLHDISEHDAMAEGIEHDPLFLKYPCYQCLSIGHSGSEVCEDGFYKNPFDSFASLWRSVNGEKSWDKNPWVWMYAFHYLDGINTLKEASNYNGVTLKKKEASHE